MIKYMGSKRRLAKYLLPIILEGRKEGQWYVEPFVGGANMIENVDGNRIGADINEYLVAMFSELVAGSFVPFKIKKTMYELVRQRYSDNNIGSMSKALVGWIGIGCSYSGKWFGGFAGVTRTKHGNYRDYQDESIRALLSQKKKLQGVTWEVSSYTDLYIPPNSIIYCDPPYRDTTRYESHFDHDAFWVWCRHMINRDHKLFVSEYYCPDDFLPVWNTSVSSSLSANGISGGSKRSVEKLFVHKSQLKKQSL